MKRLVEELMELIQELAYRDKKEVETRLTDQFRPLVEHLTKIYLYRDNYNLNGWLRTVKNIVGRMIDIVFLSNVKITTNRLKKWFYFNKIDEYLDIVLDIVKSDVDELPLASDDYTVKCFVKRRLEEVFEILEKRDINKLEKLIETIKSDVRNFNYDCSER